MMKSKAGDDDESSDNWFDYIPKADSEMLTRKLKPAGGRQSAGKAPRISKAAGKAIKHEPADQDAEAVAVVEETAPEAPSSGPSWNRKRKTQPESDGLGWRERQTKVRKINTATSAIAVAVEVMHHFKSNNAFDLQPAAIQAATKKLRASLDDDKLFAYLRASSSSATKSEGGTEDSPDTQVGSFELREALEEHSACLEAVENIIQAEASLRQGVTSAMFFSLRSWRAALWD